MSKVSVDISLITLPSDTSEYDIESVEVECNRCGDTQEVYGRTVASVKRGCVMLRENCSHGQRNFYHTPGLRDLVREGSIHENNPVQAYVPTEEDFKPQPVDDDGFDDDIDDDLPF
jgi:hypothetical protein